MKISVLGCGRWGSFIAYYLSKNNDVILWGRESGESYQILKEKGKNDYITLPENLKLTSDLSLALKSDIVVISILTQELDSFLKSVVQYPHDKQKFVFCMKGVESNTGRTLSQIAIDNGLPKNNLALWVGPGHVQYFLQGIKNCMVISAFDSKLTKFLVDSFSSDLIRFYYEDDVLGAQIGSAAKNVVGIMSGILDGLGWGCLKGALMTRATYEVSQLIVAMGGDIKTVYGLSHLGDYEATLFSPFSRNRMFGEYLAKGQEYNKSTEGVGNTKGLAILARKYNIDMPLTFALEKILFENADIKEEIAKLFERPLRCEF